MLRERFFKTESEKMLNLLAEKEINFGFPHIIFSCLATQFFLFMFGIANMLVIVAHTHTRVYDVIQYKSVYISHALMLALKHEIQ